MAMVALVVVALTVTGDLCLKNKTLGFATVMMMMRHNGVKHDNCTCQRNHCLLHQMFHLSAVTALSWYILYLNTILQIYTFFPNTEIFHFDIVSYSPYSQPTFSTWIRSSSLPPAYRQTVP